MSERLRIPPGGRPRIEVSETLAAEGLGVRLARVAMNVPLGSRPVDVGTDHARLPIALVKSGHVETAIAVDLKAAPFDRARAAVRAAACSDVVAVRAGDGLDPIAPEEVDVAIIAGMGGVRIAAILGRASGRFLPPRLVLQPNRDAPVLRRQLVEVGYRLEHEELVFEEGRVFQILVAVPGVEALDDAAWVLGPRLRSRGGALYEAWVRTWRDRLLRHDRPEDRGTRLILDEELHRLGA